MSAIPKQRLLTAEEFAALPRDNMRLELVRGEILAMPPAFGGHGKTAMRLGVVLGQYVLSHQLGEVYAAETGFLVARNPDTVRAPDVAFIQASRVPPIETDDGWVPVVPDLAAEVVSSGDRVSEVADKVHMWMDAGVRMVLVVLPAAGAVEVHRAGQPLVTLHAGDMLDGADVVPGFTASVTALFV
jgi:Uma2 family endonuclease